MSQSLLQGKELTAKIKEYEQFANDVLKVDLQKTTDLRAKYRLEVEELEELRRNIQRLQKVCDRCLDICFFVSKRLCAATTCVEQTSRRPSMYTSSALALLHRVEHTAVAAEAAPTFNAAAT